MLFGNELSLGGGGQAEGDAAAACPRRGDCEAYWWRTCGFGVTFCWVCAAGNLQAVEAGEFMAGRGTYPVKDLPEKDLQLLGSRDDTGPGSEVTPMRSAPPDEPPARATTNDVPREETPLQGAAAKAIPAMPKAEPQPVDKKAKYKDGSYWKTLGRHQFGNYNI